MLKIANNVSTTAKIGTIYFAMTLSSVPLAASMALFLKITGKANKSTPKITNIKWVLNRKIMPTSTPANNKMANNDRKSDFLLIITPTCSGYQKIGYNASFCLQKNFVFSIIKL